jgi:glycosyltransferase involved in cell wall biosynthesis
MNKKFFSIITVVLNAKLDLIETIKSLREQKFKDFEYIIIDGNSEDGTKEIIKKNLDIISNYISEKDLGIYDAMNKGLKISNGQYVGFLNAGDKYTTNGLEIIYKYLNHSNFDFIFGSVMKKKLRYGYRKYRIFWNFDFYSSHSSGFFIKKKSQDEIGKYNTRYKISSDYDLFYRMIVKAKMFGLSTKKEELIGVFKSGTSYSSKFSFLDHLKEETLIRLDNKQNTIFVFIVFIIHFLKNFKKISSEKIFITLFQSFIEIYKKKL